VHKQEINFTGLSMNKDIPDMILDGSVEFAGVDIESGDILYMISEDKETNKEDYFFYDQLKEFFGNKITESKDKNE
jgi:hypothetical protein